MQKIPDDTKLSISKMGSLEIDKNTSVSCENNLPTHFPSPLNLKLTRINPNLVINKKIVFLTFVLIFVGLALFAGGFVSYALSDNSEKGVVFWVIGCLVLIPGIYYLWNLLMVWKGKNKKNKVEIVKEINQQWDLN